MKHSGNIKSKEIISIALSKGRLFDGILKLFQTVNIELIDSKLRSRKLVLQDRERQFQFFLLKPAFIISNQHFCAAGASLRTAQNRCRAGAEKECRRCLFSGLLM